MNAGSESNCVHEQVAKADCECPIYITYTNVNGYLIPNLTYKSGEQMEQLGKYGFLRRDYLKNHRNSTYQVMLLQDIIGEHLLEVDKAARKHPKECRRARLNIDQRVRNAVAKWKRVDRSFESG